MESSIRMLFAGRVDSLVGSDKFLHEPFKKPGRVSDEIERVCVLMQSASYIAMRKQTSKAIFLKIKTTCDSLILSGELPDFGNETGK
jgi:hypothetical protein